MTGDGGPDETDETTGAATRAPTRRAEIRTTHGDPEVVAAAVAPDDTEEMNTRVEDGSEPDSGVENAEIEDAVVVTTVERETTGGLASTVDDSVVNLSVAERAVEHANEHRAHDTNDK